MISQSQQYRYDKVLLPSLRHHAMHPHSHSPNQQTTWQEYIPPIQTEAYDLLQRADVKNAGRYEDAGVNLLG